MRGLLCCLILLLSGGAAAARDDVRAERMMVAAAHPLAAEAGLSVLRNGGNAADAAVAVQAMLTVVEPQGSGIGGGTVVLHYDARARRISVYEGLSSAPAGFPAELYRDDSGREIARADARHGGRPVGVPGTLRALEALHGNHGRLPWAGLFEAAAARAERGFAVPPRMARLLARSAKAICGRDDMRALFCHDRRTPRRAGEPLVNPALAATLRHIADTSADGFYAGDIASDIVAAVRNGSPMPGFLTLEDLASYRAVARTPVCVAVFAHVLCSSPPPLHGGIAMLQQLMMLEALGYAAAPPESAQAVHLFIEASRLATADRRRHIADPAFIGVPVMGLLDPAYVAARSALIDPARAIERPDPGSPPGAAPALPRPEGVEFDGDRTSHVSIVDAEGNAVAMTTTLNLSFGARIAVRGFLLNNAMVNFTSTRPYRGAPPVNAPAPGKRPRSAMAPTLGFDRSGTLRLVAGAAGGSHIVDYVAQAVLGVLVHGLDPQGSLDRPHAGGQEGHAVLEEGTSAATHAAALRAMGHRRLEIEEMDSGAQLIVLPPEGGLRGGADPRRDGAAAGD